MFGRKRQLLIQTRKKRSEEKSRQGIKHAHFHHIAVQHLPRQDILSLAALARLLDGTGLIVLLPPRPRAVDRNGRRESRREQPATTIAADAKTAPPIRSVEVAAVHASLVAGGPRGGSGQQQGLLHLAVLLDELASDDTEHLLDALAALGADLVACIPADLLAPEPGAAFGFWTAGLGAWQGRRTGGRGQCADKVGRCVGERRGGRGRRAALAGCEVLGNVGDAALERDLARGRVAGDDVGLGADDMKNHVSGEVTAELGQPDAHVGEGLGVGDGVAQDTGVGATVVEAGDGAEALLAGCSGPQVSKRMDM